MKRIFDVARLHTTAWPLIIGWPIAILFVAFVISYTIFAVIPATGNEYNFTGALSSMYGFAVVFYLQAITQTFPFALGISVTRRQFFTASALVGIVQSALLAALTFGLSALEAATDGFGVQLRMFGVVRYATDSSVLQFLGIFATLLLVASIGLFLGIVYQRFRVNGVMSLWLLAVVVFGGGAVLITWQQWWPRVGQFFVDTPTAYLLAVAPLAGAALFACASWAGLRRATV